jgi:hypothetical protein
LVLADALGSLEECDIYDNSFTGAWVRQNGSLSIRKCKINRNAWQAVAVQDNASLTIENSDLTSEQQGTLGYPTGM